MFLGEQNVLSKMLWGAKYESAKGSKEQIDLGSKMYVSHMCLCSGKYNHCICFLMCFSKKAKMSFLLRNDILWNRLTTI